MLGEVWFVIWGILWAIYFMLDGFDLGIGTLIPFLGKGDDERRAMINGMGPFWDGNEVWLITAGGVTFAAFPTTYAIMFSALYAPLLLILFGLIIRGVSIEFRNQHESPAWRSVWDIGLFIGSFGPALLFGVAFANIFQGVPIDKEGIFHGTIFTLLNPYGLLGGLFFVLLFVGHGALWLVTKTDDPIQSKAAALASGVWPMQLVIAVAFLVYTWFATTLYDNYLGKPILFVIPLLAVVCLLLIRVNIARKAWWAAWFSSAGLIFSATMFGVIGLFPNLLPSSMDPAFSMSIANSSSSPLTLKIMLVVALIFVPIVIGYQTWAYFLFKDKLGDDYH